MFASQNVKPKNLFSSSLCKNIILKGNEVYAAASTRQKVETTAHASRLITLLFITICYGKGVKSLGKMVNYNLLNLLIITKYYKFINNLLNITHLDETSAQSVQY